ncbi:unnamed protein product, partial [Scytosiphon promiscuus]
MMPPSSGGDARDARPRGFSGLAEAARRSSIADLRAERDSLANACGRLEADREAASVQLREGGEVVRKLREAQQTLEAEAGALREKPLVMIRTSSYALSSRGEQAGTYHTLLESAEPLHSVVKGARMSIEHVIAKEEKLTALEAEIAGYERTLAESNAAAAADAAAEAEVAAGALAEKEEEASRLRGCVRDAAEGEEILEAKLAVAVAEKEQLSTTVSALQRRVAEQERECELRSTPGFPRPRPYYTRAQAVSDSSSAARVKTISSRGAALSEARSKLAALEDSSARTVEELREAKAKLEEMQAEGTEQQALFEAKVSELAAAASKISLLEDSVARHLARQRDLEDEVKVLRDETKSLEAKRDELEVEARAKLSERNQELEGFRARAAELSLKLEAADASCEDSEVENKRLQRELDVRCKELEAEKQAQEMEYERQLSERVAELKAYAVEMEAKVQEREMLESAHAEKLRTLEAEKASLSADLNGRYASASEAVKALSNDKRITGEECSSLRRDVLALEKREATLKSKIK